MLGYQLLPPPADHIPVGQRRDLLTVREAAERLHRSVDYITRRIRTGVLVGVQEGDRWVVRASDLEAYISGLPPVQRRAVVTPIAVGPAVPLRRERRSSREVQAEREARDRARMAPTEQGSERHP